MKKLKLAALSLGAKEVLSRAQLKTIFGGSGSEPGGGSGASSCGETSRGKCCVDCPGGGVTVDCGDKDCVTDNTRVKCGADGEFIERCS